MISRTGWAVGLGSPLLVVIGLVFGYPFFVVVGAAGAISFVGGIVWMRFRPDLEVERQIVPDRVVVGDDAHGVLTVANRATSAVPPLLARDAVGDDGVYVLLPRIPATAAVAAEYRLPTRRRGMFDVGPLVLRRSDPFGLFVFEHHHGTHVPFWVHPKRHALRALPASEIRSLEGPTTDSAPRGTTAFHALREYVLGDELRHVHWRTSARTGTLMVKQHVDTSLPDVTVVLDTRREAHTPESFEEAVEIAASVLVSATVERFPVRLVTTAGASVSSAGGENAGPRFLDQLALVELEDTGSFATVREHLNRRWAGHVGVVVAGTLSDADVQPVSSLLKLVRKLIVVRTRPQTSAPMRSSDVTLIDAERSGAFAAFWNTHRRM
jgi:uncharacterized protein (DUF58 family)